MIRRLAFGVLLVIACGAVNAAAQDSNCSLATQALQAFEAIAQRMGLTINRDKTRITELTEGFDFIGFQFVRRRSPKSGKMNIYIFPSKTAQRSIRRKIKLFTKRRTPIAPEEFVK